MYVGHLQLDKTFMNRLYETQCLWDEYMAESASIYLQDYPESTLVVLAGSGHVVGRTGIPNRIEKRMRTLTSTFDETTLNPPFVIVPLQVDWLPSTGLPDVDLPLTREDCDWAWYTEKEIVSA